MLTEDTNQRFLAPWWLQVPDYQLQAGDLYRIPVRARDLEALSGLDIALQLNTDGLRILEIEEGLLSTADINSSLLDRGILKAIWVKQANANAADALFTLVVEAQSSQLLSELMRIAETDDALAYQDDLTPFQLQLEFVDQGQEAVLLENYPDPFGESTQIEFFLPQAGEFVLELSDARGKVLRRYRQQALAGRQQITVFGNDLPSGILFYTLTFNERQLSRRMVKL
ncbi:MAG: T9SS type A sorting domain-containing protein, partial [Bacteroidota bacterium]